MTSTTVAPEGAETTAHAAVRALVEQAIDEGCVGPDEIATRISGELTAELRDELVPVLLRSHVRSLLTSLRRDAQKARPKSRKWEEARSILSGQVCVLGQWKPLADCDAGDLKDLIRQYRDQAEHNIVLAQQYDRLLKRLQRRKFEVVGQLSEQEVRDVLNG